MNRAQFWAAFAVWAALGAGLVLRGGFAMSFLFYGYSLIFAYSVAAFKLGLFGLRIEYKVMDEQGGFPLDGAFTVGDEAIVRVTLRRAVAFPIAWFAVHDRIGEAEHVRLVGPWFTREASYRFQLPLGERGRFTFAPAEIWVGDPFGIVQHRLFVHSRAAGPIFVAPAPRRLGLEAEMTLALVGMGRRYSKAVQDDGERDTVRAYREGDPVHRVLWKRVAKGGDWFIRTALQNRDEKHIAVMVDTAGADALDRASVDHCAATAAGAIVFFRSRKERVQLLNRSMEADGMMTLNWRQQLASLRFGAEEPFAAVTAAGGALKEADAIVIVSASIASSTILLCKEWIADGREAAVVHVGPVPKEAQAALRAASIPVIELTPGSDAGLEGGVSGGASRLAFPS